MNGLRPRGRRLALRWFALAPAPSAVSAFGGGLEVAMAMVGLPLYIKMPRIWGVKLTGRLPDWVSAKDVALEMLRRHGVSGGHGRIVESLAQASRRSRRWTAM